MVNVCPCWLKVQTSARAPRLGEFFSRPTTLLDQVQISDYEASHVALAEEPELGWGSRIAPPEVAEMAPLTFIKNKMSRKMRTYPYEYRR